MLGVSRQAIYQREKRYEKRVYELEPVKQMVCDIRRFMPRLGGRKLYYLVKPKLDKLNIKLGRDGLFDYLRANHMLVKPKRSYKKTTDSKHWMKKHPNLYSGKKVSHPEQVFVSDITYVESQAGTHYLSLITDAYSRKIMGYEVSQDLRAEHMVKALKQAIKNRMTEGQAIHHSDRGLQYCSGQYQDVLKQHHISPSMTDGYDCYQNALAERVNGILKQEFLIQKCADISELRTLIKQSVDIYNQYRPHLSLGMKTPQQVHEKGQL